MMTGEGRETTSNHILIATPKGFDNGFCSHLLVLFCKQVIIQFMPFLYLKIFILIYEEDCV